MLLSIFRNNYGISLIFAGIIFALLRFPALNESVALFYGHTMPLYECYARLFNQTPWVHFWIGSVLIAAGALILNNTLNKFEIMAESSFIPAICYVLLMCCAKPMLSLGPVHFANFFILLAFSRLAHSYRIDEAFSHVFDASFLIAIASLFYFPAIVIYPICWVALIVIRPFVWREWIITFIGLLLPYLFTFVYYFWFDKINFLIFDKIFYPSADLVFAIDMQSDSFLLMSGVLLLLVFVSFIKVLAGWSVNTILSRNIVVLLIWMSGLSLLTFIMAPVFRIDYLSIMAIPLAVFMANYFTTARMLWLADLLFLCFVAVIFYEIYT